jgi:D-arginine dehydrogenase
MTQLRPTQPRLMLRVMDTHEFDVVVVGAGIAGASAAAFLVPDFTVALVEAEEQAGYHTTGRSAALWYLNYGPADVQCLTGLSRPFFEQHALMSHRSVLVLARPGEQRALAAHIAASQGMHPVDMAVAHKMVPALRRGYATSAAAEDDAFDMDVAGLHQLFLRNFRAAGGELALRSRTARIERAEGRWRAEVSGGSTFTAKILVDAAGAWADEVAGQAGVAPLGLVPKRRTAVIIDPAPWAAADWPMIEPLDHSWYARPEARTKLLVSPADETPMHPHDVQPDELDNALAIDRMQQALDIDVRRVEHAWAGLRTFAPDGSLAIGWDGGAEQFFWCAGQGGYGIQTSPAAGRLVADVIAGRDPGPAGKVLAQTDPRRFDPGK